MLDVSVDHGNRRVVDSISFDVLRNKILLVLGHNGAGKTTLVRSIFGLHPIAAGEVQYNDKPITNRSTEENVKNGFSFVPQGHGVFRSLTVEENLMLGTTHVSEQKKIRERLETVRELFPILSERRAQKAGTMSGGQQQMLAIGIALMQGPDLLVLDEPTIGLAPRLVNQVVESVVKIKETLGLSVVIVEQNIQASLPVADGVVILKTGRKVYDGAPAPLADHNKLMEYF
ncbi:ABC transporter ATP-binding protein [Roseovarius amoyensis]|uniref:ABC transporter ATP-binding protein n=1 Tax=Roseovarius amoyensis TaxID=2211448 RepID=UPI001EF8545F|nr:ABC transporter ATP-binding protein [Roseovarius amoyensis]